MRRTPSAFSSPPAHPDIHCACHPLQSSGSWRRRALGAGARARRAPRGRACHCFAEGSRAGPPLRREALAKAARAPRSALGDAPQMLQGIHGMECSTAACLRSIGMATACGSSRLSRQSQSQHERADGCDLPRCSLSRQQTIRPQVDDLCSWSQEAVQVVAGPEPRRHAAMLQPLASRVPAHQHGSSQASCSTVCKQFQTQRQRCCHMSLVQGAREHFVAMKGDVTKYFQMPDA